MALKIYTAPAVEPISSTEAKLHCKVDGSADDTLIAGLIIAAREYCESYQNRAYCSQVWDLWLDDWPAGDAIQIPKPPLISVTHVKYYDTANAEATMAVADYFVDAVSEPGRLVLADGKSWPTTTLRPANGVNLRFTAGYPVGGTEETPDYDANVPQRVKQAMLLLIGHWYEQREAATKDVSNEVAFAVKALLNLDRVVPV